MPRGRPSDYTQKLAAEICQRLADGASLRTVCKANDMPASSTIFMWLMRHPEFAEQYTRACDQRADAIFEESLDIADDSRGDFTNTEDCPVFNSEHVQRSKLRVETRKWFVGKLNPKKYGEKSTFEHTGKDGAALVPILNVTLGKAES